MSTGDRGYGDHDCSWSKASANADLSPNPTLVVQSTPDIVKYNSPSTWTRVPLQPVSELPTIIIEWILSPRTVYRNAHQHTRRAWLMVWMMTVLRLSVMLIPLQLLQLSSSLRISYNDPIKFKTRIRKSPLRRIRYTRNWLDRGQEATASGPPNGINGAVELFKNTRLVLPRRLVIYADKSWILVKDPAPITEYLFISWHWESFKYDRNKPSKEALSLVEKMAQHATLQAGLKAYWLDVKCVTADQRKGESFSSDVYGMADIVRNASRVAILLPSEHSFYKRAWARRLWTLPEGLLAKGRLHIWTATETGFTKHEFDRVEMTHEFWHPFANDERHYPTRILAEYFEGQTELTRLEMVVTAIAALSRQDSSKFTDADIAYALMGLLRKPMTIARKDTLHQAMTKLLSLTGENEYVMERMLSSYPFPAKDFKAWLKGLLNKDQFDRYLWDIRSNCEIVGIDDIDGVVYLNDCRTLPICHQCTPDITSELYHTLEPLRSAAALLLCLFTYGVLRVLTPSFHTTCAISLCISLLCLQNIRTTDSPEKEQDFVLLEGVISLSKLQKAVFGTSKITLTYATSSSPLNARHYDTDPAWVKSPNLERWTEELYTARNSGKEPAWIRTAGSNPTPASPVSPISPLLRQVSVPSQQQSREIYHPPLLAGYTVVTLIQMSTGQVSLVQARLPPTMLLLTGEEGGMVRAVLCSSVFDSDGQEVLQKEAVLRLGPDAWNRGHPRSWLRVRML